MLATVEVTTEPSKSTLPVLYRDLPDEPPDGLTPAEVYPDCPFCPAYVEPTEKCEVPVCVACATDVQGVLRVADEETATDEGIGPRQDDDRPVYRVSRATILPGGFEDAYPEAWTERKDEPFIAG